MLTDMALKRLKPRKKTYKAADRDGMYVAVLPSGGVSFRYDYRINGRRETPTLGAYDQGGLTLAEARARCLAARQLVADGSSPAHEKQREKRRTASAPTISTAGKRWFDEVAAMIGISKARAHRLTRNRPSPMPAAWSFDGPSTSTNID